MLFAVPLPEISYDSTHQPVSLSLATMLAPIFPKPIYPICFFMTRYNDYKTYNYYKRYTYYYCGGVEFSLYICKGTTFFCHARKIGSTNFHSAIISSVLTKSVWSP